MGELFQVMFIIQDIYKELDLLNLYLLNRLSHFGDLSFLTYRIEFYLNYIYMRITNENVPIYSATI
jgi:hypothetical protein